MLLVPTRLSRFPPAPCAECHANANLPCALGDEIRHGAVDTGGSDHQAEHSEQPHHQHGDASLRGLGGHGSCIVAKAAGTRGLRSRRIHRTARPDIGGRPAVEGRPGRHAARVRGRGILGLPAGLRAAPRFELKQRRSGATDCDATLLDLGLSRRIARWDFRVDVMNLFKDQYEEVLGVDLPGRALTASAVFGSN